MTEHRGQLLLLSVVRLCSIAKRARRRATLLNVGNCHPEKNTVWILHVSVLQQTYFTSLGIAVSTVLEKRMEPLAVLVNLPFTLPTHSYKTGSTTGLEMKQLVVESVENDLAPTEALWKVHRQLGVWKTQRTRQHANSLRPRKSGHFSVRGRALLE